LELVQSGFGQQFRDAAAGAKHAAGIPTICATSATDFS
jgi:hypothetical protein